MLASHIGDHSVLFLSNLDLMLQETLNMLFLNHRSVFVDTWAHPWPLHFYLWIDLVRLNAHLVEASLGLAQLVRGRCRSQRVITPGRWVSSYSWAPQIAARAATVKAIR